MEIRARAILLLCICLIIGLSGCSTLAEKQTDEAGSGKAATESEQRIDEMVFPKDRVVDVRIKLDPADYQDMLDNAGNEEYKTASVNYNGQQIDNIAVRTKGNLSLRSVINSDSDRYSFKLSFDEYIAGQSLNGVTKINLNNNFSDASYMREFLAYELAEAMGLPTPKYSFVNVYVNDELRGFYLAVEQVGESYLKRNFGNSAGALYKANGGSGSELTWLEKMSAYTGLDLKSASSNDDIILDMLDELNNGTGYEKVLDVEEALKFIALNTLSANMDSYHGMNKHNYYLYEDDGLFSILPWDYNMAFGGFGGTGILIDEPTQGALAERPLIAKLLGVAAYKEKYHQYLSEMLKGYLSDEAFSARVKEVADLISSHVEKDPTAFYTYEQYEQGVSALVSFVAQQTALFTKQLDGTSPSSGDGSGSGGGMGGVGGVREGIQGGVREGIQGGMREGMQGGVREGMQGVRPGNAAGAGPAQGAAAAGAQAGQGGQPGQWQQGGQGQPGQAEPLQAEPGQGQAGQGQPGQAQQGQPQAEPGQGQQGQWQQQMPPDGQAGQPGFPGEMGGGFGGMRGGPGGMGGGPGGFGFGPGGQAAQQPEGSASDAVQAGIAAVLLLISCLIVVFYKRKRL
nr:CotH kinase family protein [Paenibacillus oenotherae]